MDSIQRQKILDKYSKLLRKYGYDPQSVGWGSRKGKQSLRFSILCQIGNLSNCSVLDIGCGFGDLYGYLEYKKIRTKYLGIDINPELIKIAKLVYPKAKFEVRDFEENKFMKKFDWVFFSGISSAGCSYSYIKKVMTEMFKICKKGVAMNFVGGVIDYKTKDLFYSDPEKIYTITRSLSNRVTIRHDYAPFEFTVYIYKNNKKTSNHIFKEYLVNSSDIFDDTLWHPKYRKQNITKLLNLQINQNTHYD
jgi:SAM-dependent methyltransferase